jgi:hypothetical protein
MRKAIADHGGALLLGLIMDVLLCSAPTCGLAQIGFYLACSSLTTQTVARTDHPACSYLYVETMGQLFLLRLESCAKAENA